MPTLNIVIGFTALILVPILNAIAGNFLERPYSLKEMTDRAKWRKSIILAVINSTLFSIIFFSFVPIYSTIDFSFIFRCVLPIIIVPFPILVIFARFYIQNQLNVYYYIDKQIKSDNKPLLWPLQKKINSMQNNELAQFYESGY